ncbi:MAG: GNAT family N-acetyltransferase [Myxococcota bacterium]
MRFGIQRRHIYLEPLGGMETPWLLRQLQADDVRDAFALTMTPTTQGIQRERKLGRLLLGTIRLVESRARIGFVAMVAPDEEREFWEIFAAIPDRRHRDAWSMLHTVDAMSHYMFDHGGVAKCGARVRTDNTASQAVVKRIGYRVERTELVEDLLHLCYVIDQPTWARRRARLDEGEARHPSPGGGTFVVLRGPPYVPVVG